MWADRKVRVHRQALGTGAIFLALYSEGMSMPKGSPRILSCFVDEAGDFGKYDSHCPFYIISVVLHDQADSIDSQIQGMETYLSSLNFPHHALHAGPLIRRESDYLLMQMEDRKRLFNLLFNFARKVPIRYFTVMVRKSECKDADDLDAKLTKAIKKEILKAEDYWYSFDKIIIYYDNGQKALKRVLNITFNSLFSDVELRKVQPADYRLFQVADLICTLELTMSKIEHGLFTKTDYEFFHGSHEFKKEYWRKIEKLRM